MESDYIVVPFTCQPGMIDNPLFGFQRYQKNVPIGKMMNFSRVSTEKSLCLNLLE